MRLAASVALSVATVVTLVMAAGIVIAQNQMDGDLRETAEVTAVAVADDIELRADSVPPDTLIAVLRSFLDAASDLDSITVYRATGNTVRAIVSTATVPTAPESLIRQVLSTGDTGWADAGPDMLAVAVPVRPGTERQAAVAVTVSLAGIQRLARVAGLIALGGGAIGVVAITLLIHLQVRRLVLRPLYDIASVMDLARRGNLTTRVRVRQPDELGEVATGFNQMLAELDELHRSLNDRVDAATTELRQRNEELVRSYERVSELRETVARAQQLAAVGQTLANVAHQVGTPLNLVSGHVQLMKSTVSDPELLRRLRIVEEQIARVVDVVRTLLDRAHPRTGRRPVHLDTVLTRMAEAIRGQLASRRIALTVTPSGGSGTVSADESQLELALLNLVTNAVDAMPNGGTVSIVVTEDDRSVRVHVRDSGTGIAAEVRPRLFEPWVTTKEPGRGSGLGLSITRDLVTTLGGTIDVERTDATGTTFVVELPISRDPV